MAACNLSKWGDFQNVLIQKKAFCVFLNVFRYSWYQCQSLKANISYQSRILLWLYIAQSSAPNITDFAQHVDACCVSDITGMCACQETSKTLCWSQSWDHTLDLGLDLEDLGYRGGYRIMPFFISKPVFRKNEKEIMQLLLFCWN